MLLVFIVFQKNFMVRNSNFQRDTEDQHGLFTTVVLCSQRLHCRNPYVEKDPKSGPGNNARCGQECMLLVDPRLTWRQHT